MAKNKKKSGSTSRANLKKLDVEDPRAQHIARKTPLNTIPPPPPQHPPSPPSVAENHDDGTLELDEITDEEEVPPAPRRTSPPPFEQSTPPASAAQVQDESSAQSTAPPTAGKTPVVTSVDTWRNLFASNRSSSAYPKLKYFSANTEAKRCALLDEDMDDACDVWKTCIVGYIAGKFPGLRALRNIIENSWKCAATLSMHESGWLVYKFTNEEDRAKVLSEGPYLVYGRPLVLKPMTEYFDFTSAEMYTVPIWVKFPNLPLKCWSTNCLSKIASVLGRPIQSDMLTSSMERLSYPRVLIDINLMGDLPSFIDVVLLNGLLLK